MRVRVKERRMGVFARCRRKGYSYGLSRDLRRRGAGPGMYVAGHDIGGCREAAGAVGDTTPIPTRAGVPGEPPMPTLLTGHGSNARRSRITTCRSRGNAYCSQRNAHGGSEKARNPWKFQMGPAFFRGVGGTPLGSVWIPRWLLVAGSFLYVPFCTFLFVRSFLYVPGSLSCHGCWAA